VKNSGSSLPPDFDPQRNSSLGLQIIHTLVTDDLKGTLVIESAEMDSITPEPGEDGQGGQGGEGPPQGGPPYKVRGTRAVVTFPKRPLKVD